MVIKFLNELYIVNFPPFISGFFQRKAPGDTFSYNVGSDLSNV